MRTIKTIVALSFTFLLAVSFIACKTEEPANQVAATVNGTEILESDVTARIDTFRLDQSTGENMDDVAWAQMLKSANYTPETLREYVIRNQFGSYILILQRAEAAGITPDSATVDQNLADAKASVEGQGSTWDEYLTSMGYSSEEAYRQVLDAQSVIEPLLEKDLPNVASTQDEIETYVSENASQYAGKRLSAIYIPIDETNTLEVAQPQAEEALAKINEGADFAEVVKEYSKDTYTVEVGGDLGWGSELYLPDEIQTALADLAVGDVTDVIVIQNESQNAIFILKVTDEFIIPEDSAGAPVDFASVPKDLVETLTENYTTTKEQEAQEVYFTELVESDEIVINPMPEGLPYDVDMTLADTAEEDGAETETPEAEVPHPAQWTAPEATFGADGLGISDVTEGTGAEAQTGDTIEVHYTGFLADGTFFETSTNGAPFNLVLGIGSVIPGWDQGLVGMKVGGKRQLTIPPELAYGATGQGSIPPNATLIFDCELVSVNGDSTGYTGTAVPAADGSEETEESEESEGQPSASGQ
jgi:foldase protein PrsA